MSPLEAGKEIHGTPLVANSPVWQESWGAVWRGTHDKYGDVFIVIYDGESGPALFQEVLPSLKRWKEVSDLGATPGLLGIHEIIETGSSPMLVIENPGDRTLHEVAREHRLELNKLGKVMHAVSKGVLLARSYEIWSTGLCPQIVVKDRGFQGGGWRLMPVAPCAIHHAREVAEGIYVPPEVKPGAEISKLCPDSFALSWMFADLAAGEVIQPRQPAILHQKLPYARLRTLVENGMQPLEGSYGDPKMAQLGIDRWLKEGVEEDIREHRQEERAKTSKLPAFMIGREKLFMQLGIGAVLLIVIGMAVAYVPSLFSVKNTRNTPYGISNLFLGEIMERDAAGAKEYARGAATGQVDRLLAAIKAMEDANLASPFNRAVPQVHGDGKARTVKVDLWGENGDVFMIAEMTIRADDQGIWTVDELFYKELRTVEEE